MKRTNQIKSALHRGTSRAFLLGPLVFLLVAGAGCPSLFESTTQRAIKIKQAVAGTDGAKTVTDANTVVNAYAALAGTADPKAGDTTITVANITTLATNFTTALGQGDLLLIVQMAGATVDFTTDTSSAYGAVSNLGSAGRYEFIGVESVSTNVITLACGLKNGYSRAGKTQVIRIPQYTTLTVNSGASIVASPWNGTTGGVVAVHAETTVTLAGTGKIDVSAQGFRGGYHGGDNTLDNASGTATTAGTGVILYRSSTAADGAEKGEGIAGYQGDYTNGRYGRGAVANAGGGGNSHNAGGGGGANAPSGATWSGQGVMLGTFTTDPWTMDPGYTANTSARTTSQGGGRGGYSYSTVDLDALTVAPGDSSWGGDARRDVGGLGGRPVVNSTSGAEARLFMGGGGGAGDGNNIATYGSGRGGNGGGLVFLIAGSITGAGSILANGEDGPPVVGVSAGGDAAGGGGGGGTVVVHATSISAVSISANGGKGGSQQGSASQNEVEGPGGGGGGGYIALAGSGTPTLSATGGPSGTTDRTALSEFPANGATAGNAGLTTGTASTFIYCSGNTLVTTIATNPTNPSTSATGDFTFTNTDSPVTYECQIDGGAWGSCGASYTTPTLDDGSHTLAVRATDVAGNVEDPPVTFTWVIATLHTTIVTYPTNPTTETMGFFTFTNTQSPVTYECKLDSGAWASCAASYTTPALNDGSHTLSVRATLTVADASALVEAPPVTYTWVINTGRPTTTIATYPTNPTAETTGSFTFTNTQSPVTYACKLDSGDWTACNATYTTPVLTDGTHTLSVRATKPAVDAAPLVEDPPVTYTWVINTGRPVTTIATYPKNPSNDTTGDFTFTNTQSPVTYECKLDSGAWTACNAAYTTPVLDDGTHTLSVRATKPATDAGAVVESPPVTYTWVIDTIAPDTIIATKPSDPSKVAAGSFTFQSTENPVTYECKLDSGNWGPCKASYTTSDLVDGTHTLSVRAIDAAGNVDTTPATYTWTVVAGNIIVDGGVVDAGQSEAQSPMDSGIDSIRADRTPDVQGSIVEPGADAATVVSPDADRCQG
jgi:hypothetical protein